VHPASTGSVDHGGEEPDGIGASTDSGDYGRFLTAAVPETLRTVRDEERAQQAAWTCIGRGWIGYGQERVNVIARPRKARDGGRLWGAIVRDRTEAAA
jgi:hypothetical protein